MEVTAISTVFLFSLPGQLCYIAVGAGKGVRGGLWEGDRGFRAQMAVFSLSSPPQKAENLSKEILFALSLVFFK